MTILRHLTKTKVIIPKETWVLFLAEIKNSLGMYYIDFKEKLNQKLAKNRESARNSRKRKKIYIELLETKVIKFKLKFIKK